MTGRDRRAIVIGGLVVVLGVLSLRLLPAAVRAHGRFKALARERVTLVAKARALVAARLAIRDSLDQALAAFVAQAPKLLTGSTPSEVQASLGDIVSPLASRAGVRLLTLSPIVDSAASGAIRSVAAHVALEGDIAGVAGLLRGLAIGSELLSAQHLSVTTAELQPGPGRAEVLRVELDMTGWYLAGRQP